MTSQPLRLTPSGISVDLSRLVGRRRRRYLEGSNSQSVHSNAIRQSPSRRSPVMSFVRGALRGHRASLIISNHNNIILLLLKTLNLFAVHRYTCTSDDLFSIRYTHFPISFRSQQDRGRSGVNETIDV